MTEDTIREIPLDQLRESPFNSRRQFNGLEELAASIKAEGKIHQPLLVRPILPNPLRDDIVSGFELVFGHRRLRAAALAGLATAPCMVSAMSDAEVRSAQAAENLQRENIHAFEEAQGYADIMQADGLSADQVADRVGKSRSHVYGRLTLLQACAEIRTACLAGEIGAEVALLVARLRTEKLQQKALAAIRADTNTSANLKDGGQRSFRHLRDLLAEKFTLQLKDAIFDREDAQLLPDAGVCSACPKRTGNAPEFADLAEKEREGQHRGYNVRGGPDTCTDPDCWDAKKTAHLVREAGKLQASGVQLVTGNKARAAISAQGQVKGDFIALADVKRALKGGTKKPADLPVVTIQDPRTGKTVQAVKKFDLVAKGLMKAEDAKATDHRQAYAQQEQKRREEAAKAKLKAEDLTQQHMGLLQAVRAQVAARDPGAFELRMVTAAAVACVPWQGRQVLMQLHDARDFDKLKRSIDTMDADALKCLLMDCALVDDVEVEHYNLKQRPEPLLALAEHYGIDAKAVMQASALPPSPPAAPISTPSTAGASAGKAKAARARKAAQVGKAAARPVAYRCPLTLQSWSGRGLQPAWLKAALARGNKLSDYAVAPAASKAARQEVKDEAADSVDRDPRQLDMLETAGVGA